MTIDLSAILIIIGAAAVLWFLLKVLLKLTMKVFSCGCGAILLLAVLIYLAAFLNQ